MRGVTVMDEELRKMLKDLRLWGMLEHWDEYLKLAEKQRFSIVRLLKHIIKEEYKVRRERAKVFRMQRAHIPEPFIIATFPFGRQRKLNKKKLLSIYLFLF